MARHGEQPPPRRRLRRDHEWPTKLVKRVVQRWVHGPSEDLVEGESELVDEVVTVIVRNK